MVERLDPLDGVLDLAVDVVDGVEHALAAVAVAAVAPLDGLVLPRGRARRDDGPALGPAHQVHLDLDGGVAPRVEDLAPEHPLD